eukprot:m.22503 g.22503  ORF g.22503 m.22503 type:complete len:84 (+) comp7406_c0_seq1:59-310(+)
MASAHHPSALRNRGPILQVLQTLIPKVSERTQATNVLELASGSGCHVEHFAPAFPSFSWQPSEYIAKDVVVGLDNNGICLTLA